MALSVVDPTAVAGSKSLEDVFCHEGQRQKDGRPNPYHERSQHLVIFYLCSLRPRGVTLTLTLCSLRPRSVTLTLTLQDEVQL